MSLGISCTPVFSFLPSFACVRPRCFELEDWKTRNLTLRWNQQLDDCIAPPRQRWIHFFEFCRPTITIVIESYEFALRESSQQVLHQEISVRRVVGIGKEDDTEENLTSVWWLSRFMGVGINCYDSQEILFDNIASCRQAIPRNIQGDVFCRLSPSCTRG